MKTKNIFLTLALGLFVTFGFAQGVITGSAHDFSDNLNAAGDAGDNWITVTDDRLDEICKFCHAPHNNRNVANDLLWNRAYTTTNPFTPYDSPTMEGDATQPGADSKMCLSCHDGVMALDAYGTTAAGAVETGTATGNTMTEYYANADFGVDLSNDHPIGTVYDVADTGLNAITAPVSGVGTNSGIVDVEDLLSGGTTVECSSCHDVHNNGPASVDALLVKSNTGSELCLVCHAK